MQRFFTAVCAVSALALAAPAAMAQQTTGNISGRIVDDQGAAVPGVTVTGKNTADRLHPLRRVRRAKASTA